MVKVNLQSNRKHVSESPSTLAVTKEIISKHGFGSNGLNKGLSATIMRNAVFNSFYFGFYHSVKGYVPPRKEPWLEFLTKVRLCLFLSCAETRWIRSTNWNYINPENKSSQVAIGFVSGTVASCLNIPFDVAKSRIQGSREGSQYKGTLNTIYIVYKQEGYLRLIIFQYDSPDLWLVT